MKSNDSIRLEIKAYLIKDVFNKDGSLNSKPKEILSKQTLRMGFDKNLIDEGYIKDSRSMAQIGKDVTEFIKKVANEKHRA